MDRIDLSSFNQNYTSVGQDPQIHPGDQTTKRLPKLLPYIRAIPTKKREKETQAKSNLRMPQQAFQVIPFDIFARLTLTNKTFNILY